MCIRDRSGTVVVVVRMIMPVMVVPGMVMVVLVIVLRHPFPHTLVFFGLMRL